MRLAPAAAALALACAVARPAAGDVPERPVERTVIRFLAPETGGNEHPRFVFERLLAFEARLAVMGASAGGIGDGYQEREVKSALEHDVAQQMLASLGDKLLADTPVEQRPRPTDLEATLRTVTAAVVARLGGRARIDAAAQAEHVEPYEVDGLLKRAAFAAWYLDRVVAPLLHPTDEQLHEVQHTAETPFRGAPFEQVRDRLAQWFVADRIQVAESAYLQSTRSHVRIIVTR